MMLFFMLLGLHMLQAPVQYQLDSQLEVTSFISHTPGAGASIPNVHAYSLLLTPGIQALKTTSKDTFVLRYAPRVVVNLPTINNPSPVVLHHASSSLHWRDILHWQVFFDLDILTGQVNIFAASDVASQITNVLGQAPSASLLNYFAVNTKLDLQHDFSHNWHFTNTETAAKLSNLASGSGLAAASNNVSSGTQSLLSQISFESNNEIRYTLEKDKYLTGSFLLASHIFPISAMYLGYGPTFGLKFDFSTTSSFISKAGVFKYWTSPFDGVISNTPQYIPTAEITATHTFVDIGLPRLSGKASAMLGPFYDLIYGTLEPRATISLEANWDFSRAWRGRISVQDYTWQYFNGVHWVAVPVGHAINTAILDVSLRYNYSKMVSYDVSVLSIGRWSQKSGTNIFTFEEDFFAFVGLTGTWVQI